MNESVSICPSCEQITALQNEAADAGDLEMVLICSAALDGSQVAIDKIVKCINHAAAQRD